MYKRQALYFATHGATKDSALYCINKKIIDEINKNDDRFKQNLSTDNEIHSFCNMVLKEQTMSPSVMLIAVSYTHLDVYKRQVLLSLCVYVENVK